MLITSLQCGGHVHKHNLPFYVYYPHYDVCFLNDYLNKILRAQNINLRSVCNTIIFAGIVIIKFQQYILFL